MDYLLEGEEAFRAISSYAKKLFVPFEGNDWRPWFLQSKILLYVVVFVLIAKIITIGLFLPLSKNIFFADITKIDLLNLLNQNRHEYGLNPLKESGVLDHAARLKAQDMIANGYFSHESPSGISPWFWFKQAGYSYKYAGENLAVGFADSSVVYNAWFNSPSHKDNLLNKNYKEVGTAIVEGFGPSGSIVVVQLFGSQQAVVVAPANPKSQIPNPKQIQNPKTEKPKEVPVEVKSVIIDEPVDAGNTGGAKVVAEVTDDQNQIADQAPTQNPAASARVLAGATEHELSQPLNNANSSLYSKFLNFIVYDNNRILQVFSYALLAAMVISLIINIGINFEVQRKDLIVRSLVLIAVLYVATLIDKSLILQILPHQINI